MADVYKIKYQQQTDGVNNSYKIATDNNIWTVNPLNSNWSASGCYAGARADNFSLLGSRSVLTFSGWKSVPNYCDMRDYSVSPSTPTAQQNLRFVAKFGQSGFNTVRQSFLWTGLDGDIYDKIKYAYDNNQSSVNDVYDPYRRQLKNISINSYSNTPLTVTPLNSLEINNLIWCPFFLIKEVEYYNYDSDVDGYANVSYSNVGVLTWNQIKNSDNTPAGSDYDADLFDTGFKRLQSPVNPGGIRFRYVSGCWLVPYYGKCSNIYNPTDPDNPYSSGINPDDYKTYGDRSIIGSVNCDASEYPVIDSNNFNRCNLMVITETKSSVTGGTIYQLPTGITFSNTVPVSSSGSPNNYVINTSYSLVSSYQNFAANSPWSPFFTPANQDYTNIYKNYSPESAETEDSPLLEIPSTYFSVNADISGLDSLTTPNALRIYIDTNNPVGYSWTKSSRNCTPSLIGYFAIRDLWATIANLGCYVADSVQTAQKAPTGKYVGNNDRLYLGYMDSNGVTNGTMLQGSEISSSTQSDIDDIIQGTPYTPVNPDSGGGDSGGDGEDDTRRRNDGTSLPAYDGIRLVTGTGFTSFYLLSAYHVAQLSTLLSQMPANFWEALGTATDYKMSNILAYISNLKWYPISIAALASPSAPDTVTTDLQFGFNSAAKITFTAPGTSYKLGTVNRVADMGSVTIPYKYDDPTFLDYEPYTDCFALLPYIGIAQLQANQVVGYTINVHYIIDLITGMCTCIIDNGYDTIYTGSGKIGVDMTITGNDVITQSERMTGAYIGTATNGISNALSIGSATSAGDPAALLQSGGNLISGIVSDCISMANAKRGVPNVIGSGSGFGSTYSCQHPCIIVKRPSVRIPTGYGHDVGHVQNLSATISQLSGYTVCVNPDLSGIPATAAELDMIRNLLTSGFYA